MVKVISILGVVGCLLVTGCASSKYKARQEQREKMAGSAGLYCDWINGDKHSDIDVELNMQMAKRCDSSRPHSLTPYKNSSDQNGIMFCCATGGNSAIAQANKKSSGPAAPQKRDAASEEGAAEIVEDK